MTTHPVRSSCTRGPLISVEGVTGAGKTYLTSRAVETLNHKPLILEGFSRRAPGRHALGEALLAALREASGHDPFLRGHPGGRSAAPARHQAT